MGGLKGGKAWASKFRPRSRFTPKPTAVVGFWVKPVLELVLGAGLVLLVGASSIQPVDLLRKAVLFEATLAIGLGMTVPAGVYRHGGYVLASSSSDGELFFVPPWTKSSSVLVLPEAKLRFQSSPFIASMAGKEAVSARNLLRRGFLNPQPMPAALSLHKDGVFNLTVLDTSPSFEKNLVIPASLSSATAPVAN